MSSRAVRASRPPALIIANGDIPGARVVRSLAAGVRAASGIIVCADGGSRHAMRLRIRPDAVVGDLDSLPRGIRNAFRTAPLLRSRDQESTDLEKAVRHCLAAGCGRVTVIGATGDRADHSYGALGCVRRFGREAQVRVLDRRGELRLLGRSERIAVRPGQVFSLLPLGRCGGIVLRGAEYPLRGESLEPGVRDGISNRATGRTLSITHSTGTLLLYLLRPDGRRGGRR